MIVVSDASPLMNLAAINLLDILPDLFSSIIIPPAVYQEIVVMGSGKAGADEVKAASLKAEVLSLAGERESH